MKLNLTSFEVTVLGDSVNGRRSTLLQEDYDSYAVAKRIYERWCGEYGQHNVMLRGTGLVRGKIRTFEYCDRYYGPSDYQERMEERRQMGLSNF